MKTRSLNKKNVLLTLLLSCIGFTAFAQSLPDGIKALEYGQNVKARNIFRTLIKTDPKNSKAYFYLGQAYCEGEQNDSAKYFFNQGIAANPADGANYAGLGRIMMDDGKVSDARANFDKALSLSANKDISVFFAVVEANVTESTKNPEYALQVAKMAQKVNPNDIYVLLSLGDAQVENGGNGGGDAVTSYETARDKYPKDPRPYYWLGKIYVHARANDIAMTNFQKAIELDKNFALAYSDIASMYIHDNKFTDATEYLKKYMDLNGNNIAARTRYLSLLFVKKDYKNVIDEANTLRQSDTSSVPVLRLLGYSYFETKQYKKSQTALSIYFARLGTKKPLTSDYEYLAKAYDSLKSDSMAIYNYKKVVEVDSNRLDIYSMIADRYINKGRYRDAINLLAIKVAKGKAKVQDRYVLGKTYYQTQQYELADSQFAFVNRAVPDNVNVYLWRARANAGMDPDSKKGQAKPHYELFLTKANNDLSKYSDGIVEAYGYLAYYYYEKKEVALSREYCNKVIAIDPKDKKALTLLKYYSDLDKKRAAGSK